MKLPRIIISSLPPSQEDGLYAELTKATSGRTMPYAFDERLRSAAQSLFGLNEFVIHDNAEKLKIGDKEHDLLDVADDLFPLARGLHPHFFGQSVWDSMREELEFFQCHLVKGGRPRYQTDGEHLCRLAIAAGLNSQEDLVWLAQSSIPALPPAAGLIRTISFQPTATPFDIVEVLSTFNATAEEVSQ